MKIFLRIHRIAARERMSFRIAEVNDLNKKYEGYPQTSSPLLRFMETFPITVKTRKKNSNFVLLFLIETEKYFFFKVMSPNSLPNVSEHFFPVYCYKRSDIQQTSMGSVQSIALNQ